VAKYQGEDVENIKSQIKRIKTNEKARHRNKAVTSGLKSAIRKFRDAVAAGDATKVQSELRSASRLLDVAVAKGVIHRNQAANKKSAMAKAAAKK
jgi:small subunit ribosomal protein S20